MPLDCYLAEDDDVRSTLAWPAIHLAEELIRCADEAQAQTWRPECRRELKIRLRRVATALRQVSRREDLYDRPARRVLLDAGKAVHAAAALLARHRGRGFLCTRAPRAVTPATGSYKAATGLLDDAAGDLAWLLRITDRAAAAAAGGEGGRIVGLPSIARKDPMRYLVWTQVAVLRTGGPEDRAAAAVSIAAHARELENYGYGRLVVQEDGVRPLLRLVKEGSADAKESALLAISLILRRRT